ncbi:FAD-dependent oxidoreductase [Paenibacillus rhizovicinus]|uniref:FAD-dependent oxidoreductase n=1 Tax=Paenibacillus rhizovicinus TaxID=2704463 RepID=A0A6C0NUU0_9BACL|nr:NAD(P)/FAD-dependent oxidoreductase [Paenibacillus rhizovicinus]QHW29881.1 FAD-dependent oxidoreductase [Paenibacillus rhizovicinus]
MPRTPLARLLREMYVVAGASQYNQVSIEKVIKERQEKRKIMLERLGNGSVSSKEEPEAAVKANEGLQPVSRQLSASPPRIVIVGAGLAGLTCAYRLKQAGYAAIIYEADDKPAAGRCSTRYGDFDEGQVAERGGMLIDTGHRAIRRLAREMRLKLTDLLAAEPPGTEPCYYFDGQPYTFAEAAEDFKAVLPKLNRDLQLAGFPTLYDCRTKRAFELDHMSVTDWIEASVPGGMSSKFGRLVDIACTIEYGAESSSQSALNFLYLHGLLEEADAFRMFGLSDERFHIRGGNEQLMHRLAEKLDEQNIARGHRLVSMTENADGSYKLAFQHDGAIVDVEADKVVMTVPFSILRSSVDISQAGFKPLKLEAIQELGMGTNSKLHLQFADRHWLSLGSNGDTIADTGYQNTFDVVRGQPGTAGMLVDYTGGIIGEGMITGTAEERAMQFLQQIEPVLPGLSAKWNGKAARDYWLGNPYSLGSYSYRKIGQYTKFGGIEGAREGIRGSCHFAGEHTSIEFQGYMNGAVESGERAAQEIIGDLKNDSRLDLKNEHP